MFISLTEVYRKSHEWVEISEIRYFYKEVRRFKCLDCQMVIESVKDLLTNIITHNVIEKGAKT